MDENIYYCYVYLDKRKPGLYRYKDLKFNFKPFYIGKGKNRRAYSHLIYVKRRIDKNFRHHFLRTIKTILSKGIEPEIVFIKKKIFEEEAYNLEIKIIEIIGLENLTNIFSGGEGGRNNKNFFGRKHTKKAKRKMGEAKKGNKNPMYGEKYFRSEEGKKSFSEKMLNDNHHFYNKQRSDEVKEKISAKLKGRKLSEEHKKKISLNSSSRRPEVAKKISEALKGEKNGMYGKKHSKETKRKMRQKALSRKYSLKILK